MVKIIKDIGEVIVGSSAFVCFLLWVTILVIFYIGDVWYEKVT